jgi:hypothetical protein
LPERAESGTFGRTMSSSSTMFARFVSPILTAAALLAGPVLHAAPLDLSKLPAPAGSKPLAVFPQTAIYVTEAGVSETVEACAKLFTGQGWVPYGGSGNTRNYKRGTDLLTIMVQSAPGQGGKTTASYTADTMTADIPAPPEAQEIQFSNTTKRLTFFSPRSPDEIAGYYRTALAADGWTTKMEKPDKSDFRFVMIYRHPAKGMLLAEMTPTEGRSLTTVTYSTAEEVAAEQAKAAAQGAAIKAKLAKEAGAPKPKVLIPLPADVVSKALIKNSLKFNVTAGKAKAAVEGIRKQLTGSGWKEENATLDAAAGLVTFSREGQMLSIDYMDPGFMPGEVGVKASGVEIEISK